jgi:hypothetical protein
MIIRPLPALLAAILLASATVSCTDSGGGGGGGGGSSSSGGPTSCGPGTNDNAGNGVCVVDSFLALINPANTWWSCPTPGSNQSLDGFIFVGTSSTSGTGTEASQYNFSKASAPFAFTWAQIAGTTDGVALTNPASKSLAPYQSITGIVPNDNDTEFTFLDGTGHAGCTLMSGALP